MLSLLEHKPEPAPSVLSEVFLSKTLRDMLTNAIFCQSRHSEKKDSMDVFRFKVP